MLDIGTAVNVSRPRHGDSPHLHEFSGTIRDIKDGMYIVEDQDCILFTIEQDEIESAE